MRNGRPSARPLFPDVPTVLPWPPSNLSLPLIDGAKTHVTFIVGVATQLMRSNTRYVLLGVINGTLKSMHEK